MKNEKMNLLLCNAQPVQCAVLHDNIVPQPNVPKRPKKYQKSAKTYQKSTKINIFHFLLHKKMVWRHKEDKKDATTVLYQSHLKK